MGLRSHAILSVRIRQESVLELQLGNTPESTGYPHGTINSFDALERVGNTPQRKLLDRKWQGLSPTNRIDSFYLVLSYSPRNVRLVIPYFFVLSSIVLSPINSGMNQGVVSLLGKEGMSSRATSAPEQEASRLVLRFLFEPSGSLEAAAAERLDAN
ncbi:uncharacterized protein CLUP02_08609 [Colletotrichum lupini]|uniref:Uncharacterized protein n=1 Tax=Colletotrichum lupini TaxID=145971 RepID=A0A9Q8STA0_9PEZI|nr:uncharacterized protein CLUP02_08609 [Colletotrichum lupini]UQC83116.1 hypothetical protein CLUP02_08609 [Colletotrichum lupini]